jgi:hypothetical protein
MKWLLDRLLGAKPPRPVFAEEESVERAMRIAEVKWLLADIAAPQENRSWQA